MWYQSGTRVGEFLFRHVGAGSGNGNDCRLRDDRTGGHILCRNGDLQYFPGRACTENSGVWKDTGAWRDKEADEKAGVPGRNDTHDFGSTGRTCSRDVDFYRLYELLVQGEPDVWRWSAGQYDFHSDSCTLCGSGSHHCLDCVETSYESDFQNLPGRGNPFPGKPEKE